MFLFSNFGLFQEFFGNVVITAFAVSSEAFGGLLIFEQIIFTTYTEFESNCFEVSLKCCGKSKLLPKSPGEILGILFI